MTTVLECNIIFQEVSSADPKINVDVEIAGEDNVICDEVLTGYQNTDIANEPIIATENIHLRAGVIQHDKWSVYWFDC